MTPTEAMQKVFLDNVDQARPPIVTPRAPRRELPCPSTVVSPTPPSLIVLSPIPPSSAVVSPSPPPDSPSSQGPRLDRRKQLLPVRNISVISSKRSSLRSEISLRLLPHLRSQERLTSIKMFTQMLLLFHLHVTIRIPLFPTTI